MKPAIRGADLRHRAAVIALIALAAAVRLYRFDLTWYSLDQVRDVSIATDIASGVAFPLLGPRIGWTDAYLGPLYFYLMAIPLAIAHDPRAGLLFVTAGQIAGLVLLYRFAREFFGRTVALCAVALSAVFPLTVFSSRLVWHAGLLPPFVIVYAHALFRLIVTGRSSAVVWMFAALAVLTQLHLASVALGIVGVIAVLAVRPSLRIVHVAIGAAVFAVLYAPYLRHELGHGFENTKAVIAGVGTDPAGNPLGSAGRTLGSLLSLFARALGAFVVDSEWPSACVATLRAAHAAEAVLFAAGIATCVARAVAVRGPRAPDDVARRRAAALLLLWLGVPVLMLGTRQTPIWWYYLDPIYPAPFILAAIALSEWLDLRSRLGAIQELVGRLLAGVVAAVVASQVVFLVAYQRHTAERGELSVDVPRLVVNGVRSPVETLTSLPFGYRRDIIASLVHDFGVDPGAFDDRVHGAVLGFAEENRYLVQSLSGRRDHARSVARPDALHYLVTRAVEAGADLKPTRSMRVGPYAIYEYDPAVDYESWRCGIGVRPQHSIQQWQPLAAWRRGAVSVADQVLVCRGVVRPGTGDVATILSVHIVAWAPQEAAEADIAGRVLSPIRRVTRQEPLMLKATTEWSMGLGWASETVFDVTSALTRDHDIVTIVLSRAGRVISLDVYDGRSW